MKVHEFHSTTMLVLYLINCSLFFASVCWSFPSAPLNERDQPDVSWEAWLLVNENHRLPVVGQEESPKRRIVAKSVFVAPTFSPINLPPCAEGYDSDAMGRCVKIIKIDEDKHFDFLMQKLNAQFNTFDYETVIEDTNSEPTKVDIPLDFDEYLDEKPIVQEEEEEEIDMAIIVTPTTRNVPQEEESSTKLGKRDDNKGEYEEELKNLVKTTTSNTEETTTVVDSTSTSIPTTNAEELTTPITTTAMEEITSLEATTTTTEDITTVTESTPGSLETTTFTTTPPSTTLTSTTPKITTYHPIATTYHPNFGKIRNLVRFPDDERIFPRSRSNGDYVRFPEMDSKMQQESLKPHTRDVDDQTGNFNNEIITQEPSERILEKVTPPRSVETVIGEERFLTKKPFLWPVEDHRSRAQQRRPIVLRSVPMEDLSYLFGYSKNSATNHR
ncbi:hypothetical protein ABEB36_009997 [Hypothenemus hampei]|uniref:Uncharacterized protein n=1 Tax=Hypothenemus hampei TaxID=57062 RepID=A0ABD1EIT6_HYPHA